MARVLMRAALGLALLWVSPALAQQAGQAVPQVQSVLGYHSGNGAFVEYGASVPTTGGAGSQTGTGTAPSGATTIASANTYQTLFGAASITHGCWVQNPPTNTVTLYVDWLGTRGGTLSGSAQAILPGNTVLCSVAYTNAITVYSTSTISFMAGEY